MPLIQLHNEQDWNLVLDQTDRIFLLKNSTTCPISHEGFKQFEKFSNEHPEENFYFLNVQDARPLSNRIAEVTGIKHESPQALFIKDNQVVWHASHWNITSGKLNEVFASL